MKNVFVLHVDNYRPDLCKFTLPTIRAWADKIGANLRFIQSRKFNGWPITYEKMQVHELGRGARWNILVDADFLLHPDLPDFTDMLDRSVVGIHYGFNWRQFFKPNPYLERARHTQAVAGGFVITSDWTHDLWEPLPMTPAQALSQTARPFIIDEYAMTYNLCKYGLNFTGLQFSEAVSKQMIHLGSEERTAEQKQQDVIFAENTVRAWGFE